jgi:hypothetical protein
MSIPFDLRFLNHPKDYEIAEGPIAFIELTNFSCFSPDKGNSKKDFNTISGRCYSFREFELEVDRLKNELDKIKEKAKRKFAIVEKDKTI